MYDRNHYNLLISWEIWRVVDSFKKRFLLSNSQKKIFVQRNGIPLTANKWEMTNSRIILEKKNSKCFFFCCASFVCPHWTISYKHHYKRHKYTTTWKNKITYTIRIKSVATTMTIFHFAFEKCWPFANFKTKNNRKFKRCLTDLFSQFVVFFLGFFFHSHLLFNMQDFSIR